jgi:hypothetical protein
MAAADLKKRNKKESEKEADAALQRQVPDATDHAIAASKKGLTFLGKMGIFLGFPLVAGMAGLYLAFLETQKRKDRELSFDQDFVVPFLLALAMAIIIGFQTGGYTSSSVTPLIPWPKVKRVKKIIYKNKKGEIVSPPVAKSGSAKKDE